MLAKSFDTLAILPDDKKAEYLTRLFSKIEIKEDLAFDGSYCWVWVRCTQPNGYGRVGLNNEKHTSHRAFYQLMVGPIPEGMELDHLCRVRNCCNPEHLEPVTPRENCMRGVGITSLNAKKTACGKCGGPYSPPNGRRERRCLSCKAKHAKQHSPRYNHTRKLRNQANKELPILLCMPIPCPLMP
jgi:hypothetical protein